MIVNKKARHDYAVIDTFEAGIVLKGAEVKSIREGRVSFTDSFARVRDGEVWLYNLHIAPYTADGWGYDPRRERKLLLHKHQIRKLSGILSQKGLTLLPLRIYFRGPWAKVELGLARGRHKYDKREALRRREVDREIRRVTKERIRWTQ